MPAFWTRDQNVRAPPARAHPCASMLPANVGRAGAMSLAPAPALRRAPGRAVRVLTAASSRKHGESTPLSHHQQSEAVKSSKPLQQSQQPRVPAAAPEARKHTHKPPTVLHPPKVRHVMPVRAAGDSDEVRPVEYVQGMPLMEGWREEVSRGRAIIMYATGWVDPVLHYTLSEPGESKWGRRARAPYMLRIPLAAMTTIRRASGSATCAAKWHRPHAAVAAAAAQVGPHGDGVRVRRRHHRKRRDAHLGRSRQ